ncbi:MAG: hypothetical protein ACJAVO_003020 [Parvibaculaceae bacterium]|jgi:hypothetical protein
MQVLINLEKQKIHLQAIKRPEAFIILLKLQAVKIGSQLNCGICSVVAVLLHPLHFNSDIFNNEFKAIEPEERGTKDEKTSTEHSTCHWYNGNGCNACTR